MEPEVSPEESVTLEQVLDRADTEMYTDKQRHYARLALETPT